MPKLTLIARVNDGLPLAASMEDEREQKEFDTYKNQAKRIFKQLTPTSLARCTIETGPFHFHYIIDGGVCYLTLCDKAYPRRLAYSYLEELAKEFKNLYETSIEGAMRPYAFIKFDTFIQKTKKLYMDTRTQRNIEKLSKDLQDVQKVMTKNIEDVLNRGERLETVSALSSTLANETRRYVKNARSLNMQALIRKYGPLAVVFLIVLFLLWWRFYA
eukprot:TRINITY_DN4048_c0_g1_i1.p2 TRINITY_DN4048_c0_g1~~TRINITY_DN4048_c0_g1_i1.p2  ORF type:complete len:216 (+),score=33.15 TRINITY_DN4048_c0_g1_i1:110-757(+)